VRQSGRPKPVGHPSSDGLRGALSLRRARVRAGGHKISNWSAVPHQVHDLTAGHPVDRLRQGRWILHRQFLGIHALKRSEQIPPAAYAARSQSAGAGQPT
jgi:hypothetical protein